MNTERHSYGYYQVVIRNNDGQAILHTNDERAFIIAQIQDLLSPRLIIESIPAYRQLASCLDLLAFSLTPTSIQFVLFSIDISLASDFSHRIIERLLQYQSGFSNKKLSDAIVPRITMLAGPHHALIQSTKLHLLQEDWEHSRYSSIGFYLRDRRGDWMRLWRLKRLFNNDPEAYHSLVTAQSNRTQAYGDSFPTKRENSPIVPRLVSPAS